MLNGKPVKPPSTLSAKPVPGYDSFDEKNTWPTGQVTSELDQNYCSGISSITINMPDGTTVYGSGLFALPC